MPRFVHVHLLPALFEPSELRGGTAVVIDVLRASTTICHAFAAGAECVIPTGETDEARRAAKSMAAGTAVLGGERRGVRIEGFDFGNSPAEYTRETVGGKTLVFTTTNGTRALLRSREASRIVVGCFANLNAVLSTLRDAEGDVHLVCAGTDGGITQEDVLCGGALAAGLAEAEPDVEFAGDETRMALALYRLVGADREAFERALRESRGGRNLLELGLETDVDTAGRWDTVGVVPVFDPASGRVVAGDVPSDRQQLQAPE